MKIMVLNRYLADLLGCNAAVVYDKLEQLLNQILPKKPLHEYGVTEADLPEFAHSVMTGQGRLMANSFVPLDEAQVLEIYKKALLIVATESEPSETELWGFFVSTICLAWRE